MEFKQYYNQIITEERIGKIDTNVYFLKRNVRSLVETVIGVDDIMEFMESYGKEGDDVSWDDKQSGWINSKGKLIPAEYVTEQQS